MQYLILFTKLALKYGNSCILWFCLAHRYPKTVAILVPGISYLEQNLYWKIVYPLL